MNCPKCKSADFKPIDTKEGVTVDFCNGCKGLWFEKGELAFYVETSADLPSKHLNDATTTKTSIGCPQCAGSTLVEMPYSAGQALKIDYCAKCHGVWLDAKELPKLEALARKVEPVGKIARTIKDLEAKGYQILSAHGR